MKKRTVVAALAAAGIAALVAVQIAGASSPQAAARPGPEAGGVPPRNGVKHVIYLQFDNVHLQPGPPNVPSDLRADAAPAQLPQGERHALHERPHDPDLAYGGRDPVARCTGLYPRPAGPDGLEQLRLLPEARRRTAELHELVQVLDEPGRRRPNDTKPNMITDTGVTTPAPWVPFTRNGLRRRRRRHGEHRAREQRRRAPTGDITQVFGNGSPEWNEADRQPAAGADRLRRDRDPLLEGRDQRLHQQPTQSPTPARRAPPTSPGRQLHGLQRAVRGEVRRPGDHRRERLRERHERQRDHGSRRLAAASPASTGCSPQNTLGYVAAMQEHGIPVTYGYISDVHDLHAPMRRATRTRARRQVRASSVTSSSSRSYDQAFETFFKRPRAARDQPAEHALRGHRRTRATTSPAENGTPRRAPRTATLTTHCTCNTVRTSCSDPQT